MKPILEYQHVGIQWKDFSIQDVSFSLERGYIMGLVGPNGAGKSTLFHLLFNHYRHYDGDIFVDGLSAKTNDLIVKDRIGFISEANPFFTQFDAITNANLYAPLYTTFDFDLFKDKLRSFEIPYSGKSLSTFSKGTKVKFQLAFALAHHPELYIMDEPTAGLDPVFRRDFLKMLQEIVASEEASIVISTHITTDLDKIADYIGYLEHGKLLRFEDRERLEEQLSREKGSCRLRIEDLF